MTKFTIRVPRGVARKGAYKSPAARRGGPHVARKARYERLSSSFLRRTMETLP